MRYLSPHIHCAVPHACCGATCTFSSPVSSSTVCDALDAPPSCVVFVAVPISGMTEAVDLADLFRLSDLDFNADNRAARVSIAMR